MTGSNLILVIDDEPQIQRLLKITLETNQYTVLAATTGGKGLEYVSSARPQLVLLDLGLPDHDGMEILKAIRDWSQIPIIILSVKNDEDNIIQALDLGADDYLTKPFSIGQLLARIRVCLRRNSTNKDDENGPIFKNGELQVDLKKREVLFKGEEIKLTSTEFDLLRVFIQNAGRVLTHQHLLSEVWGPNSVPHTQYLRVYIGHLRQKIEENPNRPEMLLTESRVGYRLKIFT